MRIIALALLALASCAPPSSSRVDIEMTNRFESTRIVIHAQTGRISRKLELGPGDTWEGWIVNPGGGRVKIELRPRP